MIGKNLIPYNGPEDHQSAAKAAAKLQKDLEKLESRLNNERFVFIVFIVSMFDALAFAFYKTWAAPVSLVAIQLAGLFVLAKRLGVNEVISLFFEIVRSWGKRESDPES